MIFRKCQLRRFLLLFWLNILIGNNVYASALSWQPCPELSSALRYPCRCKVEPFGPKSELGAVSMDCDNVVFHTESPILPNGAPIISFSQRNCGQQVLPTQVNTSQTIIIINHVKRANVIVSVLNDFHSLHSILGFRDITASITQLRLFT